MAYEAFVLADSINSKGCRLTTFQATYPRIVHAEMMTHRVCSRNSASTRAISVIAQLTNLLKEFFEPQRFGINQKGMQSAEFLSGPKEVEAKAIWEAGRDRALTTFLELILGRAMMIDLLGYDPTREFVSANMLRGKQREIEAMIPSMVDGFKLKDPSELNIHKQLAARGLEAYMWHTIVLSATEYANFFALRDHGAAQGEIQLIAHMMRKAYETSVPKKLKFGEWHLPLVDEGEFNDLQTSIEASVGRAASTSYGRQDVHKTAEDEHRRYTDLLSSHHMSPFEHQATPFSEDQWKAVRSQQESLRRTQTKLGIDELWTSQQIAEAEFLGNLHGYTSHRKLIHGENNYGLMEAA